MLHPCCSVVYVCRMNNTHTPMTYEQAQRTVPSPREVIEHLCSEGAHEILTPEQLATAAEDIRHIAVMQCCTGITHGELQYLVEMSTEIYFNAQSRTKWAQALDSLRDRFNTLMGSVNYAA